MPNILGVKRLSAQGAMNNRWGEKCPDFEPLCATCQAWKWYEKTGRVPQVRTVEKLQGRKAKIPQETLFYFRARLRQRFYAYLLTRFSELEKTTGLKKADLARRIHKRNELITRWLGGPNNLELDTISDLLLGMKSELWFTGRELDDRIITRDLELWVSRRGYGSHPAGANRRQDDRRQRGR